MLLLPRARKRYTLTRSLLQVINKILDTLRGETDARGEIEVCLQPLYAYLLERRATAEHVTCSLRSGEIYYTRYGCKL